MDMSWGDVDWSPNAIPTFDHLKILCVAAEERKYISRFINYPGFLRSQSSIIPLISGLRLRSSFWRMICFNLCNIFISEYDDKIETPKELYAARNGLIIGTPYYVANESINNVTQIESIKSLHNISPNIMWGTCLDNAKVMDCFIRIKNYLDEFNTIMIDFPPPDSIGSIKSLSGFFRTGQEGHPYENRDMNFGDVYNFWLTNREAIWNLKNHNADDCSWDIETEHVIVDKYRREIGYDIQVVNKLIDPGEWQYFLKKFSINWSKRVSLIYPFKLKSKNAFWADLEESGDSLPNYYNVTTGWNDIGIMSPGDVYTFGIPDSYIKDGILQTGYENLGFSNTEAYASLKVTKVKCDFRCEGGFKYYSEPENSLEQN